MTRNNVKTKNKKQIEYTSRTKPNWPASLTPDFLLLLFFHQGKAAAAAGEVCQVHNGESHVPGQLPRPRQRP